MARVTLIGPLKAAAGATGPVEFDAATIRALLTAVARQWPEVAPLLDEGVAVAIDGEIFQDAWLAEIGPDSEVHILPAIAGG